MASEFDKSLTLIPFKKTICEDYRPKELVSVLQRFFDNNLTELLLSNNINDFKQGLIKIQEQIGQCKLRLALVLFTLHSEWRLAKKAYKRRFGVNSLMQIINTLPDPYRVSRQTFNNAIMVGKTIHYFFLLQPENGVNAASEENEKMLKLFLSNYSKLPYVAQWLSSKYNYVESYYITTSEMMAHLENDSVKDFKVFIKSHTYDPKIAKVHFKKPEKEKPTLPELDNEQRTIIHEVSKHRFIYFLRVDNNDPEHSQYVKKALYTFYAERNRQYRTHSFDIVNFLAEKRLLSNNLVNFVRSVYKCGPTLNVDDLRSLLVTECVTLTQLRIAQAVIVYRFHWDSSIRDVCRQKDGICSSREMAKKYLGINDSTAKALLRIGEGLQYLPQLYETGIDPLANGSLDKLANIERTINRYGLERTIEAFGCCNVKEFRLFSKKGRLPDPFINDGKLLLKAYKRAKPFLEKLDQYRNAGWEVSPLSLYSEADIKLVSEFEQEYWKQKEASMKEKTSILLLPDLRKSDSARMFKDLS